MHYSSDAGREGPGNGGSIHSPAFNGGEPDPMRTRTERPGQHSGLNPGPARGDGPSRSFAVSSADARPRALPSSDLPVRDVHGDRPLPNREPSGSMTSFDAFGVRSNSDSLPSHGGPGGPPDSALADYRDSGSHFERDLHAPPPQRDPAGHNSGAWRPGAHSGSFAARPGASEHFDPGERPGPSFTQVPPGADYAARPPIPDQTAPAGPGTMVAQRYQLIDLVGKGGNGTVWRAKDTVLQRDVALKEVLLPVGLPPNERQLLLERSVREAQIAAGLSHPSVVRVFDVVTHDRLPWIVMELLESRSLSEILASDGPLPPRVVAKIGLALVGALQAAHEAGIVHRDVKPGNVLVSADGRCVLSDFGAAQAHNVSNGTTPGKVLGSAHYIAPERAVGGKADPPSDIFSLGVTLYAAVEGRPPFDRGDAVSTMRAVVHDPPESPRNAGPLTTLLAGMLAKEPEHRMTLAQVRQELAGVLAPKSTGQHQQVPPSSAPPAPPPRREPSRDMPEPPGPKKSSKAKPVAIVCILLLVAGGLSFLLYMSALNGDGGGPSPADDASDTSDSADPDDETPSFETALHKDANGFSAHYPAAWGEGNNGEDYIEYANPDDTSQWVRFYSNSWRILDPSIDGFLNDMIAGMEQSGHMRDIDIVRLDPVEFGGMSGHVIEYTGTLSASGEERHSIWGVVQSPEGPGIGIYVSGAADQWEFSEQVYHEAVDSFTVD
ncbi:serine/threonine-protein kinase [Natronoglycomyces albus]|uniref:non-specific serine/threonine protein kinase n=1 Tax=Natronoglycomyces albus TaxID=2811108 RepID=A0A895XQF9_9ACTN|nr:serine/threonine-protein kinase [Natronoglycomyces albus]QSB05773.1 protein kinase [Natronoglycomyces albus]